VGVLIWAVEDIVMLCDGGAGKLRVSIEVVESVDFRSFFERVGAISSRA
jgi:hypothetical protein